MRHQTKVSPSAERYAMKHDIEIVREGEVDADELVERIDKKLERLKILILLHTLHVMYICMTYACGI